MRVCAGLVLSAALCLVAGASEAGAATYCAGQVPSYYGCTASVSGIQEALDAAGANPGRDIVHIEGGEHRLENAVVYSDRGDAANELWLAGGGECERYGCRATTLAGGVAGATLVAFTGGGGARVDVDDLEFKPGPGATGLMLPPGSEASVSVDGEDGSIGIRAEGTDAHPAVVRGSFRHPIGGAPDIAIDALGAAIVEHPFITSDIGARSGGTDGLLDIRGATISAVTGVTGRRARVTHSLLNLRNRPAAVVGFEAVCPSAGASDAEITATNVTLQASAGSGDTGARAIGRGGDGDSCSAVVRLNSTILHGVETSLDARGEPGSGGDPRDGVARFEMAYSNFDLARLRQSGPSEIETESPGGNVYGDPRFNPRAEAELSWDSPLIDRGDPAPIQTWDPPWLYVVNGRRDIGFREYQFATPFVNIAAEPNGPIRPGQIVRLGAGANDLDRDPLHVTWTFSNGEVKEYEEVGQIPIPYFKRRYRQVGTYLEQVTAADPTGRSATAQIFVEVVRQRMLHLSIRHKRLRPPSISYWPRATSIMFKTRVPDLVRFRVERGIAHRGSRGLRWVRTRHRFSERSNLDLTTRSFNGWIEGRRLRPGRYRLVAAPRGVRPLRARFRILGARR